MKKEAMNQPLKMDSQFLAEGEEETKAEEVGSPNEEKGTPSTKASQEDKQETEEKMIPESELHRRLQNLTEKIEAYEKANEAAKYQEMSDKEKIESLESKVAEYESQRKFDDMLSTAMANIGEWELKGKEYITADVVKPFIHIDDAEATDKQLKAFLDFLVKRDELVLRDALKGKTPRTNHPTNKTSKSHAVQMAEKRNQDAQGLSGPSNWD